MVKSFFFFFKKKFLFLFIFFLRFFLKKYLIFFFFFVFYSDINLLFCIYLVDMTFLLIYRISHFLLLPPLPPSFLTTPPL